MNEEKKNSAKREGLRSECSAAPFAFVQGAAILHAVLLAVALVIPVVAGSAHAATVQLDMTKTQASPGETVAGEISIDAGTSVLGAWSAQLECNQAATLESPILGGTTAEFSSPPLQTVSSCSATLSAFNASSLISPSGMVSVARFELTIDQAAPAGSAITILLLPTVLSDTDGMNLSAAQVQASINVTGSTCGNDILDQGEQCDDGNLVPGDCCSPGCSFETGACDDGDACTLTDSCSLGLCTGSGSLDCDDLNFCTNDFCVSLVGCYHVNNATPCSDGQACNGYEICFNGACAAGQALDCTDVDHCTADSCNNTYGCINTPVAGPGCETLTTSTTATSTTVSSTTSTLATTPCGDLNGDGKVTASDALAVLQAAVGLSSCDPVSCDVDGNGETSAADALRVLQYAVGDSVTLPCGGP